jgi:hypothetical protein
VVNRPDTQLDVFASRQRVAPKKGVSIETPNLRPAIELPDGARLAVHRVAGRHQREIERLVPLARLLAAENAQGITVADLREAAATRGYLTNYEAGRQLSYLGAVMQAAGLVATEEWRRSQIERSHGNLHRVWRQA